jgi:hypothetical protein
MTIRTLTTTAVAGWVVLALAGCQGDFLAPDDGDTGIELLAKKGAGGGGGGGNGGSDKQKGDVYADLMIILRDGNGVPIVYPELFVDERGNETYCVQPVTRDLAVPHPDAVMGVPNAPATVVSQLHAVDGTQVTLVPIYAQYQQYLPVEEEEEDDPHGLASDASDAEEAAPGPCDIIVLTQPIIDPATNLVIGLDTLQDYTPYANEVELERLNMARAPESVLRKQMVEVESLFRTTDPSLVTLDPAGRPLFDGTIVDAMPKLQGIHEVLLETGTIPGASGYAVPFQLVSDGFTHWTTWDLSAFALGGSASKFGWLGIDAVSYHDRVMSIPTDANWAWMQQDHPSYLPLYSAELDEYFVNYGGFTYDRAATYPGCITYIDTETLTWVVGRYLDVVQFDDLGATGAATANIAGYAQMADDARAVVFFIHEHEALIGAADPVGLNTCAAQGYTGP